MKEVFRSKGVIYYDNGLASQEASMYSEWAKDRSLATPKPKLTTVWEGDSLDILARESVEGLTKHQPKGKSRYGNQ